MIKAEELLKRIKNLTEGKSAESLFTVLKKELDRLIGDEQERLKVLGMHYFKEDAHGSAFYNSNDLDLMKQLKKSSWDHKKSRGDDVFFSDTKFPFGKGKIKKAYLERMTGVEVPLKFVTAHMPSDDENEPVTQRKKEKIQVIDFTELQKRTEDASIVIPFLQKYSKSAGSLAQAKAVMKGRTIVTIYPVTGYKSSKDKLEEVRFSLHAVFDGVAPH